MSFVPRRSPTRALLFLIVVLTSLGVTGTLVAIAWIDYRATQGQAERELGEVARLMEEHVRARIQAGRIQLSRVTDLIGTRDLADLRDSEADRQRLKAIMDDMPFAHSVWIFDVNADLVLTTLHPFPLPVNVADREYFTALRDMGGDLFISPLIWGKVTGNFLFTLSRPITDADGHFRGVIAASWYSSSFVDFYRQLRPISASSDESVFALRKADGALVVRAPLPEREASEAVARRSPLFQSDRLQGTAGTWRSTSVVDGIEKMFAFRRLDDLSLVVVVGSTVEAVFRDWWARTFRTGLLACGAMSVLLLLAGVAARTARREARALGDLGEKADQLERALADKDVLFQEVHHRVKNNLQLVTSLLSLQSMALEDAGARVVLQQALDRVQSMGLVHETLYQRNEAAAVDVALFLGKLVDGLAASHGVPERGIVLDVNAQSVKLPLDQAVPLALIANEAIANALKHAFPGRTGGRVAVSFGEEEGRPVLEVRDNGVGMPTGPEAGRAGSLGMSIIHSLVGQLHAGLELISDQGTVLRLILPEPAK